MGSVVLSFCRVLWFCGGSVVLWGFGGSVGE